MVETNQFKHGAPEMADKKPVQKLRLLECYRLAEAYDITYPPNCVKRVILPLLESAEAAGVFLNPPKDPELLLPPGQRSTASHNNPDLKVVGGTDKPEVDVVFTSEDEKRVEYQGPQLKYCVMQGESRVASGLTKDQAEAQL